MTAQILSSELSNLIQESKRKHSELRNAAEKSLEDLKLLRSTSEAQITSDLSHRPNFITPFLIACATKNVKFIGIAVVCLQRLVVSKALPKQRLKEVLEALREASSTGQDVQLKILQALPSLLQNYADEIRGDLLAASLNICMVLQSSKNAIVNNTAAATLQQLVVSVFDKVVAEDKLVLEIPTVGEVPTEDGSVQVRAAARDAYKVFNDICLLTECQKPQFLRSAGLPQTFGLELIESVLTNHSEIFLTHPEQASILRGRVMPFIISSLSEKLTFAVTVRITRILYILLKRHLSIIVSQGEMAFGLLTHMLDQDTALWKRSLCMEVLRGIFSEAALIRRVFAAYDAQEERRSILRDLVAAFVKISSEKPAVIGLGPQSTVPAADQGNGASDQAMLEASGVSGIIGSSAGANDSATGISTQWSTMRVPVIDQLDKTDPPSVPETYIYSLTLACIGGFSEGLAKFILPLTVPDARSRKKVQKAPEADNESAAADAREGNSRAKLERQSTYKRNPVPVNPLSLEDHPLYAEVKTCAGIVEECWPAILATCSTFLYASLDSDYYHGLVRSFQKFTHVAGLLRLHTPRDAFLTTLGKAAVPPNVLTASASAVTTPVSPTPDPMSLLSNARGLLSVDALVHSTTADRGRQPSVDSGPQTLNIRNLLCLRALLNLGIALGPTLDSAWIIILGTLQQADFVLYSSSKSTSRSQPSTPKSESQNSQDASLLLANFGSEIKAVETAAARLLESTVDFPNEAFVQVLTAMCGLLGQDDSQGQIETPSTITPTSPGIRKSSQSHRRIGSISVASGNQSQEDHFALAKLGDVASINIDRLMAYDPDVAGWSILTTELILAACSPFHASSVRLRASEIQVRLVLEAATATSSLPDEDRGEVQLRLLGAIRRALEPLQSAERQGSVSTNATDIDVHKVILEGLNSLLEKCGETLVSGWEIAFDVIGSVFISNDGSDELQLGSSKSIVRSARLIRSSFNSLQLICSDFLASLPNSCFLILVNTLYRFCTQDEDLNISLTTVTFFWVLSDFISGRTSAFSLSPSLIHDSSEQSLVNLASGEDRLASDSALWMLLLSRLTAVTADDRLELRNSAIQTLLRIFDAYGDQLSSEAWSMCLRTVIFKLLSSTESRLESMKDAKSSVSEKESTGWYETTVVVLNGITGLLANYLDVLTSHQTFGDSWKALLGHFNALLEVEVQEINTAVFKSLQHILSKGNVKGAKTNFDDTSLDLVWNLWSNKIPTVKGTNSTKRADDQNYLLAYISAFQEIYRLIEDVIEEDRVRRALALLHEAIEQAAAPTYSADIEYLTPLQSQVVESLKLIRTNIPGVPAALISKTSEFVTLAFRPNLNTSTETRQPTYVALSKAAMVLLESLILSHTTDNGIYSSGAFSSALDALAKPIMLKYSFPIITKSISPWRQATTSALAILGTTLPIIIAAGLEDDVTKSIWEAIVTIANAISAADCSVVPDMIDITGDQEFDIISFRALRDLMVPALGSQVIPDKTRRAYTESLFRMSLIHTHDDHDLPQHPQELFATLYQPRKGRTVDPSPSPRTKMSYVCFDELISLVTASDSSSARVKLAQAASPYLIIRAGLTIQAYIADQPLRGRMPQPLSQRKELLYILKALVNLRCEPDAIPDIPSVESTSKKHLIRLYPLFSKAIRTAADDQEILEWLGKALDEVGMEFGV
ncbi:endosomal peripheral membrane protein-like protein [Xylogone sp. PMI_703]|nr:endosomal peripheral membrane protein-like protein [Xylogone sp. PMI_703]